MLSSAIIAIKLSTLKASINPCTISGGSANTSKADLDKRGKFHLWFSRTAVDFKSAGQNEQTWQISFYGSAGLLSISNQQDKMSPILDMCGHLGF